jgi:hypothetical protein
VGNAVSVNDIATIASNGKALVGDDKAKASDLKAMKIMQRSRITESRSLFSPSLAPRLRRRRRRILKRRSAGFDARFPVDVRMYFFCYAVQADRVASSRYTVGARDTCLTWRPAKARDHQSGRNCFLSIEAA